MTTKATVQSVVIGSDKVDRLKAYLYGHTELVFAASTDSRIYAIIETTVESTKGGEGLADRVVQLATNQCERLQSGLYFAIVAGDNDEAWYVLAQQVRDEDRDAVCDAAIDEGQQGV